MVRSLRRYQLTADLVGAGLFFLLPFPFVFFASDGGVDTIVLLTMAAALAVRRLSPGIALAIAWASAITQMALHATAPAFADIAVFAVLYVTAAYGGRVVRWIGLGSVGVGAIVATLYLAVLPWIAQYVGWLGFASGYDRPAGEMLHSAVFLFVGSLAALGLPWTIGLLARTYVRARESRRAQRAAEQDVVVEQERNRIARDMHDVVAHSLAVVIAQADGARYARAADPGAVDDALVTIAATAREALGDVRILLAQLRHTESAGPQPVVEDLDRLLEQLRASGLIVDRQERGTAVPLATGRQLAVYRIVQEALTNVLRHGDTGREVRLLFDWQGSSLVVSVESATRPGVVANPAGHGLAGMRERAILAGGTFAAEQRDGHYLVTARIPTGAEAVSR
ncbi:MAG TPA: histidine kinase [Lacisediminihabitans sp.]|uniref:sensor histidine kinase n=1 Tax=Lacisediminihabitans sp. TaxID=2787631 RepID=UPI002ED87F25